MNGFSGVMVSKISGDFMISQRGVQRVSSYSDNTRSKWVKFYNCAEDRRRREEVESDGCLNRSQRI